jgi:hypothetical protein
MDINPNENKIIPGAEGKQMIEDGLTDLEKIGMIKIHGETMTIETTILKMIWTKYISKQCAMESIKKGTIDIDRCTREGIDQYIVEKGITDWKRHRGAMSVYFNHLKKTPLYKELTEAFRGEQ